MTVPNAWATSFNFLETAGVVDVSTTITRLITQLVAVGWTNNGGNNLTSVADSAGRTINCQFNRIAATTLEMVMTDSLNRAFTRRTNTPATFTERLYCNSFGFYMDPSNASGLWASMLDMSPELQSAHDQFAVGHGFWTAANADDGTFQSTGAETLDASNPRVYAPIAQAAFLTRNGFDGAGSPAAYSQVGSRMWFPCIWIGLSVAGGPTRIRGRSYQSLWVSSAEAPQSEFSVPLDQATTGLFKVLSFRPNTGVSKLAMAARKA